MGAIDTGSISAIVLAGGEAQRMGGKDKGLVDFYGRPLISHVIERIAPQVSQVYISANRNLERYREFSTTVQQDLRRGFQGPLAGIEACAALCKTPYTLIVSCDSPSLPLSLASRLLSTLNEQSCVASFADDGKRQHYLCLLIKTSALGTIGPYLDQNKRSVHGWLQSIGAMPSYFAGEAAAFQNINQPSDIIQPEG